MFDVPAQNFVRLINKLSYFISMLSVLWGVCGLHLVLPMVLSRDLQTSFVNTERHREKKDIFCFFLFSTEAAGYCAGEDLRSPKSTGFIHSSSIRPSTTPVYVMSLIFTAMDQEAADAISSFL